MALRLCNSVATAVINKCLKHEKTYQNAAGGVKCSGTLSYLSRHAGCNHHKGLVL